MQAKSDKFPMGARCPWRTRRTLLDGDPVSESLPATALARLLQPRFRHGLAVRRQLSLTDGDCRGRVPEFVPYKAWTSGIRRLAGNFVAIRFLRGMEQDLGDRPVAAIRPLDEPRRCRKLEEGVGRPRTVGSAFAEGIEKNFSGIVRGDSPEAVSETAREIGRKGRRYIGWRS